MSDDDVDFQTSELSECPPSELLISLPRDIQSILVSTLTPKDVANMALVCKSWKSWSTDAWQALLDTTFADADEATLDIIKARTDSPRETYRQLFTKQTCSRCGLAFSDGGNTPTSCRYHNGPMIGGGLQNGVGLTWVCCHRRAHHISTGTKDSNGCTLSYHVAANSAWKPCARSASGVTARTRSDVESSAASSSSSSSSSSPRKSGSDASNASVPFHVPNRGPVEWLPNQRPGVLELPSRLLISFFAPSRP